MTIQSLKQTQRSRALARARCNTDYSLAYRLDDPLSAVVGNIRIGAKIVIMGQCNTFRTAFMNYLLFMMLNHTKNRPWSPGVRAVVIQTDGDRNRTMPQAMIKAMQIHDGVMASPFWFSDAMNTVKKNPWQKSLHKRLKRGRVNLNFSETPVMGEEPEYAEIVDGGVKTTITIEHLGRVSELPVNRQAVMLADYVFQTSTIDRQLYVAPIKVRGKTVSDKPILMKKFNDHYRYYTQTDPEDFPFGMLEKTS